jgi:single-strand DNA-binding protein
MLNRVEFIGNLGGDPEMRYVADGTPVTNFSVAANRKWNNPDGTPGEETTWFRVACWRRLAEIANEYLHKGSQVHVEGRLKAEPRVYQRGDGSYATSYEITATTLTLLGGRSNGASQEAPAPVEQDEIPF